MSAPIVVAASSGASVRTLAPRVTNDAGARKLYRRALQLALGPLRNDSIPALLHALDSWPEGSAPRRFLDLEVLLENIIEYFSAHHAMVEREHNGETLTAPDRAVAVCWANRL